MFDRLKRITDLFVEGREAELGMDEAGVPVLIWVNKLNSFEEEEARRDGLAARTERMLDLKDDDHPDVLSAKAQLAEMDQDALISARVNQKYDEDFMTALNDLETDKGWAEKLEYLRRMSSLLSDAGVPEDDERRQKYAEVNDEYMVAIRTAITKLQDERRTDLAGEPREDLEKAYLGEFRERDAFHAFVAEKRITELFFSLRDCEGVREEGRWNHDKCDHRRRLLVNRSDVRSLPQGVIETVINVLDNMSASARESGNSAAPESSSASSEPQSDAEVSTPSIPAETPSGVPAT